MNWYTTLIPDEFILSEWSDGWNPPVLPVTQNKKQKLWGGEQAFDWDWRYMPEFQVHKIMVDWEKKSISIDRFPRQERYWLAIGKRADDRESDKWVLVEGEIAAMILHDAHQNDDFTWDYTLLFIAESGNHYGSYLGHWASDFLLSNSPWASKQFYGDLHAWTHTWKQWETIVFERHPDCWDGYGMNKILADADNSFYAFCRNLWRDYVIDLWHEGTDKEVKHAMKTVEILDAKFGGDEQFLTIWDDLAIAFYYPDQTNTMISRMYDLLPNPTDLFLDMHDEKGMEINRAKTRKRDRR